MAGTAKKETICAAAGLTSETCAGVICNVKRCGRNRLKTKRLFVASGLAPDLISHLDLALRCTSTSDRQGFPKLRPGELKSPFFDLCCGDAASKTAKQHGLASSRSSFFDLYWGDLQCQTLRPEPLKKRRFVPLQDLLRRPVLGGLLRALFRTWTWL